MTDTATIEHVAADAAAALPAFTAIGHPGRIEFLHRLADAITSRSSDLAAAAEAETGLGEQRLRGEAARTAGQFGLMADVLTDGSLLAISIDHRLTPTQPGGPRPDLRRTCVPIGVVAVYAASNFPLAFGVAGTDAAAALAAGCPVIAKAHPYQPHTADLCAEIVRAAATDAGLPADVFQVIGGFDTGRALIQATDVKAGAFTGSAAGGRALFDLACARPDPIPFYGELGSVNPVIVTPAAARHRGPQLGHDLAESILTGHGQFCTQPGLILIPDQHAEPLRAALAAAIRAEPSSTLLGPPLAQAYTTGLAALADLPGAELIAVGSLNTDNPSSAQPQLWQLPADVALHHLAAATHENFGPSALLITYRDTDELLRLVHALPGSLTISIHSHPASDTDDAALTRQLYDLTARRAGRIIGDGVPTGVAVTWAQHHGGPWPATTQPGHTSVGAASITRFLRPVTYQDVPTDYLPPELTDNNPLSLTRRIDGRIVQVS